MRLASRLAVVMCALSASIAAAAPGTTPPAPAQPVTNDKMDAKALMQSGLRLYQAKDFLGALAVFKTAYARFPSAKILLNIGTTLAKLDRKAEAANVYQHYLDSPDADPAKRAEVEKVLAELDAAVALLELTVTPSDAELQIDYQDWLAADAARRLRVAPGSVTLRARHPAYQPHEQAVQAAAGARLPITIALIEIPAPVASTPSSSTATDQGIIATATPAAPRSRFGVVARAHFDPIHTGGAGLVGATADLTDQLEVHAAALLGPSSGAYAGASFAILRGKLRPIVSAGLPIFFSEGARVALRGAGGVELVLSRHLAVIAELGVEYAFNPETDVDHTQLVPAIGATGRL